MPQKKGKRKYTFRKGQPVPYESGSLVHEVAKTERDSAKTIARAMGGKKKKHGRLLG